MNVQMNDQMNPQAIELHGAALALDRCIAEILYRALWATRHASEEDAQKILDDAAAIVKTHGGTIAHSVVVIDREAASGIVGYAEMNGVDHIVMGTGDKRGLSRLMLGSVASDVAGRAHCSVTVAR